MLPDLPPSSQAASIAIETDHGPSALVMSRGGPNKITPINRIPQTHFEIRIPDSHTNVHLQLAAVLGVGLLGIEQKTPLSLNRCDWAHHDVPIPDEMKKVLGVSGRIQDELGWRLQDLEQDRGASQDVLGKEIVERYLWFRKKEVEVCGKADPRERRKLVENL